MIELETGKPYKLSFRDEVFEHTKPYETSGKFFDVKRYRKLPEGIRFIMWSTSRPDGQPRRMLDTTRAFYEFGFKAKTSFKEGLKKTIDWYISQH